MKLALALIVAATVFCFGMMVYSLPSKAQEACAYSPIGEIIAKFEKTGFKPVAHLKVLVGANKTIDGVMIANSSTGAWFILTVPKENLTCFPIAGEGMGPST
jgi:cadmium resistance protein CadD (predicted permease)